MGSDKVIAELLKDIEELPTPDFHVQQIINIASNPDASVKTLEKAISTEPTLSLKVLKLVNSAYYGLPKKVTKISEAVMILGFKTVRNLALSLFTYSSLNRGTSKINKKMLWKHFMSTAIISEVIAKNIGYPEQEEAFMAGLLHDVGKIVLDIAFPEYLTMIVNKSRESKINLYKLEKMLEVETHNEIGSYLIEKWQLPELYQIVSKFHDEPEENTSPGFNSIVFIVHLSNYISNLLYPGYSGSFGDPILSKDTFKVLGIKPSDLLKLIVKSKDSLAKAKDLMEGGEDNET
jgi:HD-like signal output (HDOD) protein